MDMEMEDDYFYVDEFLKLAELGNIVGIKQALASGWVDVCSKDKSGRTALHVSVANGNIEAVRLLISEKADVSAMDVNGNSPLHLASLANKSAIVSLLLQAGVNPNQQDSLGKTPISWVSDRITHMRTAIYHRRLQYADEDEIVQIKEKLLNELYTMINQLNTWSQNCSLATQLQQVANTVSANNDIDLHELDALFDGLSL